jgi:phage shock protein B
MTFSISPDNIGEVIEIASIVGTIVTLTVFAVIAYFLVRPKRRRGAPQRQAPDQLQMEEMLALMDRMERRLETLERAIGDDRPERIAARREDQEIFEAAESREQGRMK